jgi:assimilatory nitrate reductase catalytic subunit
MKVKTTCAYCGVGCGVIAKPDGNGGATIQGDKTHPANYGRLCLKGANLGQTLSLEDRILEPHVNGSPASWDTATDLIAEKIRTSIKKHGPDSVAFYVSGQLLTEDYYVANKLMKGFIGSSNIDTNSRLCMASSVVGHKRAFGTDTVPGIYADLDQADLIVLVGSNLAWCHPVLHQRIMAEKELRGTKIINIDPRKTATSDMADMHLGIKSGGDVALFNGLLTAIAKRDAVDDEYVQNYVDGFEAAHAMAQNGDPSIEEDTGLSAQELNAFYDTWISNKRVVTIYSQGVNQSSDGSDKVNAIINCHLATGRIGKVGCGPFSVTGQPNAMGGREVGGLANMLAAHLDIENQTHRTLVSDFWKTDKLPTQQGLKAVDLFTACAKGDIKVLWIMCTNPAVSMPNANNVAAAIKNVDFVVVSDLIADTNTTRLADVILPATAWGEKAGTVTNSERRISRQRAFLPAPGQAKHDWKIICDVASKMGFHDAFDFEDPHQVFVEWAAMTDLAVSEGKDLDLRDLSELTASDYKDMKPVQWPVRRDKAETRFFANGKFFTDNGRAKMLPLALQESPNKPSTDYPLTLNTGRIRDHWHTMTRSGKSPSLSAHIAEPFLEIHPIDAKTANIKPADLVLVNSPHGEVVLRAVVTDRVQMGNLFAPIHWTSIWASKGRVDTLIPEHTDPLSGQPELKRTQVKVKKFTQECFGFAISVNKPNMNSHYWAQAQTKTGWRVEFSRDKAPDEFETFARQLLGQPTAEAVCYTDKKRDQNRIAFVVDGVVVGAVFSARRPVQLSRQFVVDAFDQITDETILAGVAGANGIDPGPTVCSCFNVGVNTLIQSIETGDAVTIEDIGTLLQAGTNCGSCRPELANLLHKTRPKIAAE